MIRWHLSTIVNIELRSTMNKVPAYRRIEAHLRTILPTHKVGDVLPTIGELCELFNVSGVSTIRNAYRPLIDEGLVATQNRPTRRWVVARIPEPRPVDPVEAVRADLENYVEELRNLLSRAERTLAHIATK